MIDLLTSPWIPATVLLLAACAARVISKGWFAPSAFAVGLWSIYVIVPLLIAPEYKVSALSVSTVLVLVLCFAVGAALGEGPPASNRPRLFPAVPAKRIFRASLFFTAVGLAGAIYFGWQQINEYGLDLSGTGVFLLGRMVTIERYGGQDPPAIVRLFAILVFPAAILGGMSYALAPTRRQKLLCFGPLIPALFFSLLNATRANALMAVVLGVSGYFSMRIAVTGRISRLISRRAVLAVASSVAIAISFFFAVETLREHKEESDLAVQVDWPRMKAYSFGYLATFSHWIDRPDGHVSAPLALGAYTFGGVFDALGLHPRELGVYQDFVTLDAGQDNNIYTAFRSIVQDFSLPGAGLFLGLFGFAGGYAYRKTSAGHLLWIPILAGAYAFLVWSPLGSIFVYNGSLAAFAASALLLGLSHRLIRRPQRENRGGQQYRAGILYPGGANH